MKLAPSSPVLIIGAHRSGTSATARALELLGLCIGQRLDSHREPYGLQQVHERCLQLVGGRWFEPEPLLRALQTPEGLDQCVAYLRTNLRQGFGRVFGYGRDVAGLWLRTKLFLGSPWGWKEPRTTLFAPAWLDIFPNARFLHVMRDPAAAAASIRERELKFQAAGDGPSGRVADLEYATQLVKTYIRAGESLRGLTNYHAVKFEKLQTDPTTVLRDAARFCGLCYTDRQLADAATTIRPAAALARS